MKASLWLSLIFFWFQFLLSLDELIYFSFMQLELSQPSPERFLYDFLSGPKHTMTSLMKHREDISDEKLNHHQTTVNRLQDYNSVNAFHLLCSQNRHYDQHYPDNKSTTTEQKAQTKILSLPYRFCIHKLTYYVFVMLNVYILLSVCII